MKESEMKHATMAKHRLSAGGRALFLLVTCSMASSAHAGLDSGMWPMFHRDVAHAARSSEPVTPFPIIAWSAALSDTVEYSSPVIGSEGVVYLGDQGKELWAFGLFGGVRWHYHTGGNLRYGSAAVRDDGVILIGSADGRLYALDRLGGVRWTSGLGGAIKTSPAIAPDGTIYVGCDDGKLYALDSFGLQKWTVATGDTVRSSPAIGPDGTVYFGSNDGFIRAVYPDGTIRWAAATGGPVRGAPAYHSGNIVVGSADGFLYSIQDNGQLNWATYTGNNLRSSPAIGGTGKIYFGMDTKIVCFHDDGSPSFEFETGARVLSSPAVCVGADTVDTVVCGSDNGNLYAIRGGVSLWTASIGSPIRSSPAIGPFGYVYVGAMDGKIYAIGSIPPAGVEPVLGGAGAQLLLEPNPATRRGGVSIRIAGNLGAGRGAGNPGDVEIFDPGGRRIRSLHLTPGQLLTWDLQDERGAVVAPGVYLARWSGGSSRASGRVVLLR
jgi:outer membrane protein assembly factor BamB